MCWASTRSVLVAFACTAPAAAAQQWTTLGTGGCRSQGGLTRKLRVQRGLADLADCRQVCDVDPECTAVVFGIFEGSTICHILAGGPYTHSDAQAADFSCSVKTMYCRMPYQLSGYSFDRALCGPAAASPQCEVQCAQGYAGSPVAYCVTGGGEFGLEGCALLSSVWRLHASSGCTDHGALPAVATQYAASLAQCQAACEVHGNCAAVTYHAAVSRCHLFPGLTAPQQAAANASSEGHPECWTLDPAVASPAGPAVPSSGPSYEDRANAWLNVRPAGGAGAGEQRPRTTAAARAWRWAWQWPSRCASRWQPWRSASSSHSSCKSSATR
ncbi:unnamed protein product [Prorocentrum cordatum]|uniref:Apple domain-containing protein n=1 Tax=Prorocentrum cordatum TaxID=2364126 RepID=A0ABN9RDH4_9DINO|nr:unnamed protein product [Polarella glacialis]